MIGSRERQVTGDEVLVGVAQPRRGELDEHLTSAGRIELDLLDAPRSVDFPQDRGLGLHGVTPRWFGERSVRIARDGRPIRDCTQHPGDMEDPEQLMARFRAMADADLHDVAEAVRQVQTERAIAAGDLDTRRSPTRSRSASGAMG